MFGVAGELRGSVPQLRAGAVRLLVPPAHLGFPPPPGAFGQIQQRRQGDQIVRVTVETPHRLNRKQKDLLKQFEQARGESDDSLVSGFAGKVRELFE